MEGSVGFCWRMLSRCSVRFLISGLKPGLWLGLKPVGIVMLEILLMMCWKSLESLDALVVCSAAAKSSSVFRVKSSHCASLKLV